MLETVRAYCAERLGEAGEGKTVRTAHAAHVLDFAERARPLLHTAEQMSGLRSPDAGHETSWPRCPELARDAIRTEPTRVLYTEVPASRRSPARK